LHFCLQASRAGRKKTAFQVLPSSDCEHETDLANEM
jgi:hypothetical protein